jgi:hypothetical protein
MIAAIFCLDLEQTEAIRRSRLEPAVRLLSLGDDACLTASGDRHSSAKEESCVSVSPAAGGRPAWGAR